MEPHDLFSQNTNEPILQLGKTYTIGKFKISFISTELLSIEGENDNNKIALELISSNEIKIHSF